MKVEVLGCSGGIGGDLKTTSFLVDNDILIDAGTGVGDLSIAQLVQIDHIFVTHSHMDHIAFIPLLMDTVFGMRPNPVIVHATVETTKILKEHIFNWKVWPDFNAIPDAQNPFMLWHEISVGVTVELDGRKFTPLPANHVVPAIGFHIEGSAASMVFTGDTTSCATLWEQVNHIENLKYLIIETAFSNAELELAKVSKHICPSMLVEELSYLSNNPLPEIYITHLKPGEGEIIMREIAADAGQFNARPLFNRHVFELG